MKQSRVKRLVSKKLAKRYAAANPQDKAELATLIERESAPEIARMVAKGYVLATKLETGEGVFVREQDVAALHIQLSNSLYRQLDTECRRREVTKRAVVTEALEAHFARQAS